jgi:precorrin-6B methylase 1
VKSRPQIWVYPLFVLAMGLYGLHSFAEKSLAIHIAPKASSQQMAVARSRWISEKNDSNYFNAIKADSIAPHSPFGQPRPPRAIPIPKGEAKPLWIRPTIILKGTVGNQAATLINSQGNKSILRIGEYLDSILVVNIQPGRVTLRDSHGTFEISAQE